jgi:hypothetical protein
VEIVNVIVVVLLAVGLVLVVRDTIRRTGRWGINSRPIVCPRCGATPGPLRMPNSGTQALWGGRTCKGCGCHMDKWGREIV